MYSIVLGVRGSHPDWGVLEETDLSNWWTSDPQEPTFPWNTY